MTIEKIKERLKQFQSLSEQQKYQEFLFCLLTPQSKAQSCWEAVEQLSALSKSAWSLRKISEILKTKTRFHNTKAKRILNAPQTFNSVKLLLTDQSLSVPSLRNSISKTVNGYGLKEASHFLRNIGLSNNQIAILDRHILKNLKVEKIKSPKHYLEIEQQFLNYAKSISLPADVLDLQWWSKESGTLFK